MTDRERPPRKPTAIRLDAPDIRVAEPGSEPPRFASGVVVVPEALPVETVAEPLARLRGRGPWGKLFLGALGGLVSLGIGLSVTRLVEELFATSTTLGVIGLGLAGLLLVSLLVLVGRETLALMRLAKVERMHERAVAVLGSDDRPAARALASELKALYAARPDMARARGELDRHLKDIVDGADLVRLAERALFTETDQRALRLVTEAAKRVSLVTAISPRAVFDVAVVVAQSARLIRALAELYGARPGSVGSWRLARQVAGHLAVTGGMAVGDTLVQQLIGHGLAARLSAKLGEGVINGMMTARVGLATIDLVRPLPFTVLERPKLASIMGELTRGATEGPGDKGA